MAYLKALKGAFFYRHAGGQYGTSGVADIMGVYQGIPIAFEVKTPERIARVSDNQRRFLDKYIDAGGKAYIVTSVDDVRRWIESLSEESQ